MRVEFEIPGKPVEVWKKIEFADGYYVSNYGRVRSSDTTQYRSNGQKMCCFHIKGKILTAYYTGKGNVDKQYPTVCINRKNHKVHRLVAEAFIENPNGYDQVNHIDGNKHNNVVTNLEWCNGLMNIRHASRTGLIKSGENAINHKLTEKQVKEIRKTYKCGDFQYGSKPLARKYGVSQTTIKDIIQKRKWKNI